MPSALSIVANGLTGGRFQPKRAESLCKNGPKTAKNGRSGFWVPRGARGSPWDRTYGWHTGPGDGCRRLEWVSGPVGTI